MKPEFNLIDEPWILVRTPDCTVEEVSLRDALLNAHRYADLAGELPTQDVAVLRLLLAVLFTVFSKVDENGDAAPLLEEDDALDRWEALWTAKQFPQKPIEDYLARWHERFWLFHEEVPFYQVPNAKNGTAYEVSKLNGEIAESNNAIRLFPLRTGQKKNELKYSEAARWLLYLNAFDDSSNKPKQGGKAKTGTGWLGKLGVIFVKGENLYETLMLNLVLLENAEKLWSLSGVPAWELEKPREAERIEIVMPHNFAELLTLQSRRIWIRRDEANRIIGYNVMGGDVFSEENALAEPMTLWKSTKEGAKSYRPKEHDPAKAIWREFSGIAKQGEQGEISGVSRWIAYLEHEGILERTRMICFEIVAVKYDPKKSKVTNAFSDQLTFHVSLLTELGSVWCSQITEEIALCDKAAQIVTNLSDHLEKAAGNKNSENKRETVKARFYALMDAPFRAWLQTLRAEQNDEQRRDLCEDWRNTERRLAIALGRAMVDEAGEAAFVGRNVTEKEKGKDKTKYYSAPQAYSSFCGSLKKKFQKGE